MARQFDVVIERDEEGLYVASVPQLPGCHTDAASLDELMVEIREAIELCLEVEGQEPSNRAIARPAWLKFAFTHFVRRSLVP